MFLTTITEILEVIKEIIAIFHYISDIMAILELLKLMSMHGSVEGFIIWSITALISGFIAEFLQSNLPTPIRIILKKLDVI